LSGHDKPPPGAETFAAARKVTALDVMRHHNRKVIARGKEARGACPLCGAGEASKSAPFVAQVHGALWHCHACGDGGDSIRLEQLLGRHADALAAARALCGEVVADRPRFVAPTRPAAPSRDDDADSSLVAEWLRRASVAATDTPVESWLSARGLDPLAVPEGLALLRWCPDAPIRSWRRNERFAPPETTPRCPAMVAPLVRVVTGADGQRELIPSGVHVTYLSGNGRSKAKLLRRDGSQMPARKFFGEARGAAFLLTGLDGPGPLIVGEGLETVWAVAGRFAAAGTPFRAIATLSLANLQGSPLGFHDQGAFRLDAPQSDPERPPFVVADPGHVIILVDSDMAPVQARVCLTRRSPPTMRLLSSIERAELCGALAAQAWTRAGAASVRVMRPRIGQDFNDVVRESL
jgi:DNA primase